MIKIQSISITGTEKEIKILFMQIREEFPSKNYGDITTERLCEDVFRLTIIFKDTNGAKNFVIWSVLTEK